MDTDPRPLRRRRTGRVIVLDPDDRVLLLRYDIEPPTGTHWCTPGGGVEDGESFADCAGRELAEETGWTGVALGPRVHQEPRTMEFADAVVRLDEVYFLARTSPAMRPLGDVAAWHAADGIAGWRWWTVAELEATEQTVYPPCLPDLIKAANQSLQP